MGRPLCGRCTCCVFCGDYHNSAYSPIGSCIPEALSWVLVRKIDAVSISDALRLYVLWSGVRLALLAIPVVAGFLTYYMVLSNKGVLCALIALTASLFCLPGEKRLREELHIDKEQ